jgi:hypothetical protein
MEDVKTCLRSQTEGFFSHRHKFIPQYRCFIFGVTVLRSSEIHLNNMFSLLLVLLIADGSQFFE